MEKLKKDNTTLSVKYLANISNTGERSGSFFKKKKIIKIVVCLYNSRVFNNQSLLWTTVMVHDTLQSCYNRFEEK